MTGFDRPLLFTIPSRNARGRIVRLGPTLDTILAAHAYPPPIKHTLAEALVLTALLGTLLKDPAGQLTIQAQTQSGVIDLLVCDYRGGELRGYVRHHVDRLAPLGANPPLSSLFGEGYLAITFDLATTGERYQGIVPLKGDSLAEACEHYFEQSEQIPTLIRVGVRSTAQECIAAGLLVQHLPEGEEGRERFHVRLDHPEWEHISALAGSLRHEELVDPALEMESLLWRLFHEEQEIRVEPGPSLARGCRCTVEHFRSVLARFPEDDRAEMRDESGEIVVSCEFCSRDFVVEA